MKEENEKLIETLEPIWLMSAEAGYNVAEEAFDLGISWDLVRDEFLIAAEVFGLEEAQLINGVSRDALKELITDGLNSGDSNLQIRDAITDLYSQYKTSRAVMIARTETHMATTTGTYLTYEAAGIEKKEWLTTIDGREREWHETMNGQIRNIDEPFTSGQGNELMYPGDPSAPANEVINCRCALLPIV